MLSETKVVLIVLFLVLIAQSAVASDIVYSDKEIVRNGDFEIKLYSAWHQHWCGISPLYAKDGDNGIRLDWYDTSDDRYFFQKLTIPSELESATIRFDYRAVEDIVIGNDGPLPVVLQVRIAKSKGFDSENLEEIPPLTTIGVIYSETIEAAFDWKQFTLPLEPAIIREMQAAHDDGEFVFLLFSQTKLFDNHGFATDIDNISLKVNGIQKVPEMHGKIVYLEDDDSDEGDAHAINILDPNDRSTTTIWTHPNAGTQTTYRLHDARWNPEATQIAFISDHEFAFSPFTAEIYTIKPDGSGLGKITNAPSLEEINTGNYPRVTVKGRLQNQSIDATAIYSIILGIAGTDKGVQLSAGYNESVAFTIYDVPVLDDPRTFDQPIIMRSSGNNCPSGIEYFIPLAPVADDGTVDVGTVGFLGSCQGSASLASPYDLSWKHDGSKIGFTFFGLKQVPPLPCRTFGWTELEPGSGALSSELAWSPVDDRYLYYDFNFNGGAKIYLAEEGGASEAIVQNPEAVLPAWLPDGSGFVYVGLAGGWSIKEDIYAYDLRSGQTRRLTYFCDEIIHALSISPDGRHIVFEKQDDRSLTDPGSSNLWIMDRLNPVELWPITDSGNCRNPDWSRKDVDVDANPQGDGDGGPNDPAVNGGGGGGGGGGCFISSGQ